MISAREAAINRETAVQARMRIWGLSEEDASRSEVGHPNAGTLHGVMFFRGELTLPQWQAAEWYVGKRNAYLRAISAPRQATGNTHAGGILDEDEYAKWCNDARRTWKDIMRVLDDEARFARFKHATSLERFLADCVYTRSMVGDLRMALNLIGRVFLNQRPD